MSPRPLSELNLMDDFLFTALLSDPEYGEQAARIILETLLQRKLGHITVCTQRAFCGSDSDRKGVRLDVEIDEFPDESIAEDMDTGKAVHPPVTYDIEPDQNSGSEDIAGLPKRARYYHSMLDRKALPIGVKYDKMKSVVVIFIMNYDPWGKNCILYTARTTIQGHPAIPYDDGVRTLFFYTRGTEGGEPDEIRRLLKYFEHTDKKEAVTPELRQMQGLVDRVKAKEEVSIEYMKSWEYEWREKERREESRAEGLAEGLAKGEAERKQLADENARLKERLRKYGEPV